MAFEDPKLGGLTLPCWQEYRRILNAMPEVGMQRSVAALTIFLALAPTQLFAADRNLSRVFLAQYPLVSAASDPQFDSTPRATFSLFPYSLVSSNTQLSGLMEKQVLYNLRNALESRGYQFVTPDQKPDLIATIQVFNEYKQFYVPPETVTIPRYVASETVSSNWRGSLSTWSGGRYSWGTFDVSGTTTLPGYWTSSTVTRPGYMAGYYYPTVGVYVHDGRTFELVWQATGVGSTREWDARLAMQVVLRYIASEFPRCSYAHDSLPAAGGRIGAALWTFTDNGSVYYPTVVSLVDASNASRAGLKLYDMITSVDGVSTANRPYSEILGMLAGAPSTPVALGIQRGARLLNVTVQRDQYATLPPRTLARQASQPQQPTNAVPLEPAPQALSVGSTRALEAGANAEPKVRLGMTIDDVTKLLGPPNWTASFQETTRFAYEGFSVIFESARVVRTTRP